jgi:diguanylate cyclase (GGDEF)-like protein
MIKKINNLRKSDLEKRVAELESQVFDLKKGLIHDQLTGLKTRTFFEEELGVYLTALTHHKQGKRKEWFGFTNISIIFFDIDHFKNVNDTYGHDVGDIVLRQVTQTIQNNLRTGDTTARWGGEEIIVSLPGANERDAMLKAEKIRARIEKLTFSEVPDLHLTISAGVASSEVGMLPAEIIKYADQALYTAKREGRNRVVLYSHKHIG